MQANAITMDYEQLKVVAEKLEEALFQYAEAYGASDMALDALSDFNGLPMSNDSAAATAL